MKERTFEEIKQIWENYTPLGELVTDLDTDLIVFEDGIDKLIDEYEKNQTPEVVVGLIDWDKIAMAYWHLNFQEGFNEEELETQANLHRLAQIAKYFMFEERKIDQRAGDFLVTFAEKRANRFFDNLGMAKDKDRLNVLIIDDHPEDMLKGYPILNDIYGNIFDIDTAKTFRPYGEEKGAIGLLANKKYDLILIDSRLDLSYENGSEAIMVIGFRGIRIEYIHKMNLPVERRFLNMNTYKIGMSTDYINGERIVKEDIQRLKHEDQMCFLDGVAIDIREPEFEKEMKKFFRLIGYRR